MFGGQRTTEDPRTATLESVANRQIERAHDLIKASRWRVAEMEKLLRGEITIEAIQAEQNLELQRLMFERYGLEKYLADAAARVVKKDRYGELLELPSPIRSAWGRSAPIRAVKVKNSTAEPDGTFKDYFLRVPPETKTPREGIAWTFGLQEHEYEPGLMT